MDELLYCKSESLFDTCNIYYESWQIQCCGDPFKVGDVIHWTCKPVTEPRECNGMQILFNEEHHDRETHEITGVVVDIWAENTCVPKDPSVKSYDYKVLPKTLTLLVEADGFESVRKDTEDWHYIFWGYVVTLKDVRVTKLLTLPSPA